jgi:RNA polymerase sigma factor (sigma-70 family)
MSDARELLIEFARNGSEAAFQEIVTRFIDLVYSTAVRLVDGDADLAKDVTQGVFVDLAKMAESLSKEVMLGGWLHRHTCFLARKTMRTERRRQERERRALEMNALEDHTAGNLEQVAPALDEAINDLSGEDRAAILARFFEKRDFRGVGEAIGGTEEAARKRVSRALEKLAAALKRRGVVLSTAALAGALGTGVVNAAPSGLAVVIATSAGSAAAAGGGTALTILYFMNVTKTQMAIVGALALGLGAPLVMQQRTNARLTEELAALRPEAARVASLTAENQRLSNLVAAAKTSTGPADSSREVMKLRGEVGSLRRTAEQATATVNELNNKPSVLKGLSQNPDMAKLIHDQQKMGLGMVYKGFADTAKLPKETMEKLNDLMADYVMTNIEHITTGLQEGKTLAQMEPVFAAEEKTLDKNAADLLGADKLADYQKYTRDLTSSLSADQFKGMMEGDDDAKAAKRDKFYKLMQEETAKALAAAGLPASYQTLPTLNFRNFASADAADQNLQLLGSIYSNVAARAGDFMTPKDLQKFQEFQDIALRNNRAALDMNRKMMSPPAK